MLFVPEASAHESAVRWEGLGTGSAFLKRVLFLKFSFPPKVLFWQRNETIPWFKTAGWLPCSWRKQSGCQIRSDWPGESSSQPGSAEWQRKGETGPDPTLALSPPHSPIFPPCSPLSTNHTHTNIWEKPRIAQNQHTLIPKPDPHSVKELKSGKNKKDSQPNYYCTTTTS